MADYYVAAEQGVGDLTTVNDVNSLILAPGDRVFFRRGDTWRGQRLTIDSGEDGSEGNPILFGAYGSGATPIISGAVILSNWVSSGANWYTEDLSSSPEAVYDNDRIMTEVLLVGDVLPGKWFWDSGASRVYLRTFEDDTPTNHTMDGSTIYQAVYCQGKWIEFENLQLEKGHQACIEISSAGTDVKLTNLLCRYGMTDGVATYGARTSIYGLTARKNGRHGVYVSSADAHGAYLEAVLADQNTGDGIQFSATYDFEIKGGVSQYNSSDGLAIVSNTNPGGAEQKVHTYFQAVGNGATGILLSAADTVDLDQIWTYSNTTHGVELASTSTDVTIERLQTNANGAAGVKVGAGTANLLLDYSVCYDNDIGVDYTSDPGTGNTLYNLVLYDNDSTGIDLTGSAAAVEIVTIRNVIMSDTPVGMVFDTNATTNTHDITNNCYYACPTAAVNYDGTVYTVADIDDGTYYAAVGYDQGSIGQSPQFTDPPNDFRPAASSACLNAGASVGLVLDFYGVTVPIQLVPDIGVAEIFEVAGPPPPGPPPGQTVEERLAEALSDLAAGQVDLNEAAGILVQGGNAPGFPAALTHVRTGQGYLDEAVHRLGAGGPEPPPPPPPPPPPIEPPPAPPRSLPPMQARTADLIGWVPGVGAWSGWAVTPEGVASITQGETGQIKGKGAQAVKAMPTVTYWVRAEFEVKIERTMLTRPDEDTVLFSLASYGGRFVPRNRIVPNIPLDPNPYVNLAPLLGDLAEESISLRLVSPESDGLSLRLENILDFRRRVETITIREDDALQPGRWTKVELLVGMSARDTIYGSVRFADMEGDGVLGETHEFETWLLNDTATPFVWAWCGPLEVPSSGWVEYRNISLSSTPWERG